MSTSERPAVLGGRPTAGRPDDAAALALVAAGERQEQVPKQAALVEASYAGRVGNDWDGRPPRVIAVLDGSQAMGIAARAMLATRKSEGDPSSAKPSAAVSALSLAATLKGLREAGLEPRYADLNARAGCATAVTYGDAVDQSTELVVASDLHDDAPDVELIRKLCNRTGTGFIVDNRHGPMFGWNGVPGSRLPDVAIVGTPVPTTGADPALIVVFDAKLAKAIRGIRDAREPQPVRHKAFGLLHRSIERRSDQAAVRREQLGALDRGLDRTPGLPWRLLPKSGPIDGTFRTVGLTYLPHEANQSDGWQQVGRRAAARALAEELVTPVHLGRWVARNDTAREFRKRALFLDADLFSRENAAEQVLGAMRKLDLCLDGEFLDWARNQLKGAS